MSSCCILVKIKAYIENFAYEIQVDVLGEIIEGHQIKFPERILSKNSEGSLLCDGSWELNGEESRKEQTSNMRETTFWSV